MANALHQKFGIPNVLERPWDNFWANVWRDAGSDIYFTDSSMMSALSGVENYSAQEFHDAVIASYKEEIEIPNYPTSIYCEGKDIVGKNVLELGSGCGWLGKQLALYAKQYAGFDYSKIAVAIANTVSSENASFNTFLEPNAIESTKAKFDTVITGNLLIHSNYSAALAFAKLANWSLKSGGIFYSTFFCQQPDLASGSFRHARSEIDLTSITCGYDFTRYDIQEIAQKAKFEIVQFTTAPEKMRTYVVLRKK